jgi:hypothetical protein
VLGTTFIDSNQIFAHGLGIFAAKGQNLGVYYVLQLESWSGRA